MSQVAAIEVPSSRRNASNPATSVTPSAVQRWQCGKEGSWAWRLEAVKRQETSYEVTVVAEISQIVAQYHVLMVSDAVMAAGG